MKAMVGRFEATMRDGFFLDRRLRQAEILEQRDESKHRRAHRHDAEILRRQQPRQHDDGNDLRRDPHGLRHGRDNGAAPDRSAERALWRVECTGFQIQDP